MKILVIIMIMSLALTACGIKGDPEAPGAEPIEQTQ